VVSNTEAGLVELRAMMADRRLADSKRFACARQELGIDPLPGGAPIMRHQGTATWAVLTMIIPRESGRIFVSSSRSPSLVSEVPAALR
jgi:hypothetical protein